MNQSIDKDRLKSLAEFWPYYICEHTHPVNRALHFAGSTLGLVCLIAILVAGNLWFIPLGLVIGYGFAWAGHFFIERNRPAAFKYPLWSLCADWKMWSLILVGRMGPEVRRATTHS